MKPKIALAFSLSIVSLTGCIPAAKNAEARQAPPELADSCYASGLDYAFGKTLTDELEAKLKSEAKAAIVRVASHDGVITMDFSPARLNIFIDETRKIIRINCG